MTNNKKERKEIRFIAFGAGQCSSVLPFILDENDYDYIIFADTGFELELTYEWIKIIKKKFPEKFVTIKTNMPNFKEQGLNYHPPICTKEYKILPIRRWLRKQGATNAIKYLGMTTDESRRIKENSIKWIKNDYPLIKLGMSRKDCQQYLLDKVGFVPPRSGCTICKFFNRQHLISS